jgi:hypothetical protein
MIPQNEDARRGPSPEQLAAYVDGELDRPEMVPLKRRVEDWLAACPEAATEVDAQRRLAQVWQATTPPEPGEDAWAAVLARLEQTPVRPVKALRWRPAAWVAGILAACAAAVWLTLVLLQPRDQANRVDLKRRPTPAKESPAPRDTKAAPAPVEPFEVVTADEVEILSVRGADTGTLVVGEVPVRGELVLPLPGEVEIKERADAEVRVGGSPMIWSPLTNERDEP